MASTGEVACFGENRYEAYLKAQISTGFKIPKKNILISIGSFKYKNELLPTIKALVNLGYTLYASMGTADFYSEHGVQALRRLQGPPPVKTHVDCISSHRAVRLPAFFLLDLTKSDRQTMTLFILQLARQSARCDYGIYVGASKDNSQTLPKIGQKAAALKMYLNETFTTLKMDDITDWMKHFEYWPKNMPICAHAEGTHTAAVILLAELYKRPVHICHVARKAEVYKDI
ncbi:hypothetical protein KUTeg_001468 [Tegillarca granosa]|uniref:MGS-like domain-containing protein n=1 Tax=Tegillarca granosa TaxID=220873 RepID=A0ABQ9FRI4_TEGGR|nr:hypothetical protein KUTeg_001468 [Tegillarca granosa]